MQGINNTKWQILRWTGATLTSISSNPALAAKFIRSNVMMDYAVDYRTWRNGMVFNNSLVPQNKLTVVEG